MSRRGEEREEDRSLLYLFIIFIITTKHKSTIPPRQRKKFESRALCNKMLAFVESWKIPPTERQLSMSLSPTSLSVEFTSSRNYDLLIDDDYMNKKDEKER